MKAKKGLKNGLSIIMVGVVLIVISILFAQTVAAIGIAPSRKVIDYEPGKTTTITARIINDQHHSMRVVLNTGGDLKEYVKLDNNIIDFDSNEYEKSFTYSITLPKDLKPGKDVLKVAAVELPKSFEVQQEDNIVIATTAVIHQLIVNVPYPRLYAEARLTTTPGNKEKTVVFTIGIQNLGNQDFEAYSDIIIKSPTNQEIAKLTTDKKQFIAGGSGKLTIVWEAPNPGLYTAEVVVHYNNKFLKIAKTFEAGGKHLRIKSVSIKNFKLGSVARFNILLESLTNKNLEKVYADLKVATPKGSIIGQSTTAPIDIAAFSTGTLQAYWDTEGVEAGDYDLDVTIHYNDKTLNALFKAVVGIDNIVIQGFEPTAKVVTGKSSASTIALLVVLVVVLVVINLVWLFYLLKKRKSK